MFCHALVVISLAPDPIRPTLCTNSNDPDVRICHPDAHNLSSELMYDEKVRLLASTTGGGSLALLLLPVLLLGDC